MASGSRLRIASQRLRMASQCGPSAVHRTWRGMMLDSDLIQCSLERQDSVDRARIALLGVKDTDAALSRTYQQEL